MTRTFRVNHRTEYRYGATMTDGYTVACLVPRISSVRPSEYLKTFMVVPIICRLLSFL